MKICPKCTAGNDSAAEYCWSCKYYFFAELTQDIRNRATDANTGKIDDVCVALFDMGLDARITTRHNLEQNGIPIGNIVIDFIARQKSLIYGRKDLEMLRIIEITGMRIKYLFHVRFSMEPHPLIRGGAATGGQLPSLEYNKMIYVVPDLRISDRERPTKIRNMFKRSFPLFGPWNIVYWKDAKGGKYSEVDNLNGDTLLNEQILKLRLWVEVLSLLKYNCWGLINPGTGWIPPTPQHWDCYETIARHLLES